MIEGWLKMLNSIFEFLSFRLDVRFHFLLYYLGELKREKLRKGALWEMARPQKKKEVLFLDYWIKKLLLDKNRY